MKTSSPSGKPQDSSQAASDSVAHAAGEAAFSITTATQNNAGIYVAWVCEGYNRFASVTGLTALEAEEKALRIARACNSHAALVAALEELLAGRAKDSTVPAVIKARAALESAKQ